MAIQMKIPAVGESITEVTVGQWSKQDGDFVEMDEVICELESDKATFELNAEAAGILRIKAQEGDVLEIGATICEIEEGEASSKPAAPAEKAAEPEQASSNGGPKSTGEVLEMVVPPVGESIAEVTVAGWTKSDGDIVEFEEVICELESDKATFELNAEAQGKIKIIAQEGETIPIGAVLCKIEVMEGAVAETTSSSASAESAPAATSVPAKEGSYAEGHPSPVAKKILDEKGIDPANVKGTGVGGRITKEDALNAQPGAPAASNGSGSKKDLSEPAPKTGNRNQNRERLSNLRKTISRRLVAVKNETAMLTTFNEVDMKPVMDLRAKYKEQFKEKNEIGLGFMSFFTKAVCVALQEWPAVNAFIDEEAGEMVYNDYCDISIAVSTPKGLVVPVIRNAEDLSFAGVEKEIRRLALKARDGKLTIPEMEGGTFTITNGGVFGSMLSTPIINAPQSAILGMHNIVERPIAVNGEVVIRPVMYVALSYDHRVIDGRESVSFLVRVKELLEDPARLLLEI